MPNRLARRPQDVPAYGLHEAASLVGVPDSTLRSWTHGRTFPKRGGVGRSTAIIQPANNDFLSFTNLVEAHVLAAMRRQHALKLEVIRTAVRYVHEKLGVDHPLAVERFKTDGVNLFVERLGKLITASREGQLAMKQLIGASLDRVEYDKKGHAVRLFPLLSNEDAPKHVVIDPAVAFGRPVVVGTAVPVHDIRSRFQARETVEQLAADYDISIEMVEDALRVAPAAA